MERKVIVLKLMILSIFFLSCNMRDKNNNKGSEIESKKNGVVVTYDEENVKNPELYHEGEFVMSMDKNDLKVKEVYVFNKSITINIPHLWKMSTIKGKDNNVIGFSKNNIHGFNPTVTITYQKVDIEFGRVIKNTFSKLEKSLNNFKLVAQGKLLIDKKKSFQITYLFRSNDVMMGGVTTWIEGEDNLGYIIHGYAENDGESKFLKYKSIFQEISASFKITGDM